MSGVDEAVLIRQWLTVRQRRQCSGMLAEPLLQVRDERLPDRADPVDSVSFMHAAHEEPPLQAIEQWRTGVYMERRILVSRRRVVEIG